MPAKKIVKKVSKKVETKKVKAVHKVSRSTEPHFLFRHISVTSPLGIVLVLGFLIASYAVGMLGYSMISGY